MNDKIINMNEIILDFSELVEHAKDLNLTEEEVRQALTILNDGEIIISCEELKEKLISTIKDLRKPLEPGERGSKAGKELREKVIKSIKYNGLPSVNTEIFNGFPEDERFYSFFFDGEKTEAVDMLEMEKIMASDEYHGQLLALVLQSTKIFIATAESLRDKVLAAMASGCVVLAPACSSDGLKKFDIEDNVHLSFYTSNQDLREQIEFFLHNRIKRVCTARNGQFFVTSNHTDKIRQKVNPCG